LAEVSAGDMMRFLPVDMALCGHADNKISLRLIEALPKPQASRCGVSCTGRALVNVSGKDGEYLGESRHVTGFTIGREKPWV